jgi:hypothetical protein
LIGSAKEKSECRSGVGVSLPSGSFSIIFESAQEKGNRLQEDITRTTNSGIHHKDIQAFRSLAIAPRALDVIRWELSSSSWQSFWVPDKSVSSALHCSILVIADFASA